MSLWNLKEVPSNFEHNEYSRLFAEGEASQPGGMRKFFERQNDEEEDEESNVKLYIHPVSSEGLGVFEFEDLG